MKPAIFRILMKFLLPSCMIKTEKSGSTTAHARPSHGGAGQRRSLRMFMHGIPAVPTTGGMKKLRHFL